MAGFNSILLEFVRITLNGYYTEDYKAIDALKSYLDCRFQNTQSNHTQFFFIIQISKE